ncbi:cupin domain-containing protein [Paenibacillus qinlingensis]|uniref:Mannose-6-phosphate isomerase-like protein (Cupin superfamily) n=1 Tax=Paenibacillus qinlingensis TaxID=1837343 RepID=A0ABU1P755_9BACL|nr:cupin domain-containing protein [Paenibacillus qinlingensis]MDR6555595.1 mannose-6-phosphate isomerase-like protein (cupin superfamily) [Paenibacillus qinlingensis]
MAKPIQLRFPDGMTVTLLEQGNDEWGDFLRIEHQILQQGAMNPPHWHPILTETFEVKQGLVKGIVDGVERELGPGDRLTIYPKQVHQFFNVGQETLIGIHEVRPPGCHWDMFVLHHQLAWEGKLSQKGVPYNPLWLGVIWKYGDGYDAGAPAIVQKVVLGGLARLAKALGYRVD